MFQLSTAHQEKMDGQITDQASGLLLMLTLSQPPIRILFWEKTVRMISTENVERERTIYLKGHFEKVPILSRCDN